MMSLNHFFDIYFPLPFRISGLILWGIWLFGLNLKILEDSSIDLIYLYIDSSHKSVYRLARILSMFYNFSLLLFWLIVIPGYQENLNQIEVVNYRDVIPWLSLIVFFFLMFYGKGSGKKRFLSTFKRIIVGGIDLGNNRLCDILLSDCLTSYAKVFVDFGIMTCLLANGSSSVGLPNRKCGQDYYLIPLISSVPFLIRLRQCFSEYKATGNKRHLYNLLKYASSLPVIILSTLHSSGKQYIFNLWVLSIFVNSTYSFIWDVTFDWDLSLLLALYKGKITHQGLRPLLCFPKYCYFAAIAIDYLLRFTWSLKLSNNWYQLTDYEFGIFVLELLEIVRRWIWVFFRVDSEWANNVHNKDIHLNEMNAG